jgi:hypothetical protein
MAAFKGHLGHNYHVLIINIRSFSHLLMPVPFEKGTSTPQARNGWDMQSENDPHLDRSTLKDLWQPWKFIWVILSCLINYKSAYFRI